FFSSRRRHTRSKRDWSSDVCSSDLILVGISEDKYEQCKYGFFQHYGTSRGVVGTRWAEVSFYESIDECDLVITKRIQAELMKVRSEERRVGKENKSGG